MKTFKLGDIVKVICDYPCGSSKYTKGNIGVVSEVFANPVGEIEYTVHTKSSDYVYVESELDKPEVFEVRAELKKLLTR